MKRFRLPCYWGAMALAAAASAFGQGAPAPQMQTVHNAFGQAIQYGTSYQSDTSLPLAYIAEGEQEFSADERDAPENWSIPLYHPDGKDSVVQDYHYSSSIRSAMPGPILTFDGMANNCGCAPPDTDGEVGKTQFVQMTNAGYQVFDKTTGNSILGPKSTASIWTGFGGVCENNGRGDPVVLYDQLADRWVISQFAGAPGTNIMDECIAVSTTSDATGSFKRYGFHLGTEFYDYPHLGVWPDGYYMSMNVFQNTTTYLRPQGFAFDRAAMIAGNATAAFVTNSTLLGSSDAPLLPADLDGSTLPPANAAGVFLQYPDNNTYRMYRLHADYVTPANTTFTLVPNPPATAPFSRPCTAAACVPTPAGSANYLSGLDDRLMFRLAYRNFGDHESLVGNYTVKSNNVAGVRWFELRNITSGTPVVYQESTYQPDTTWRWMGSVAMDRQGNLAAAYSASDAQTNPQLRYAGRLANDTLNTLTQTEAHLFDGPGSQMGNGSRWGDYSDLTVDPTDDCTFWFTSEYAANGNWRTRIGSFKFPGCAAVPDFTLAAAPATQSVCAPGTSTYTVTVGQSAGFTNPVTLTATGLPAGVTAAFSPATVTPGANPVTSTLTLTVSNAAAAGTSTVIVTGTANGSAGHTAPVSLVVTTGVPAAATPTGPAANATGVSTSPAFTWTAGANTASYTLEVATDAAFTTVVKSVPNLTATTTSVTGLTPNTKYWWRVKSVNGCGTTTSAVSASRRRTW